MDTVNAAGLGDREYKLAIYIANRPPLTPYESLNRVKPLEQEEVKLIVEQTGNHWRKIFNLYAKLGFLLDSCQQASWQEYRDNHLLQAGSRQALLFSPPEPDLDCLHIVAGKQHAVQLGVFADLIWLDEYFAVHKEHRLIVCPYLDYRQLSNTRLDQLLKIVYSLT